MQINLARVLMTRNGNLAKSHATTTSRNIAEGNKRKKMSRTLI
jgi:hypothetical protein